MIEILLFIMVFFLGCGVLLYAKINIKNKTIDYISNFIFSKTFISFILFLIISWIYSYFKFNNHKMFFWENEEIIMIYGIILLIIFCSYFKFNSLVEIPLFGGLLLMPYLRTIYSALIFLITLFLGNFAYIYLTKTKYKKINYVYNFILSLFIISALFITYCYEKSLIQEKKRFYDFKQNLNNQYISYDLKKNKKNEYVSNFYKMKFNGCINLSDTIDLNYKDGVLRNYTINYKDDGSIYILFNLLKNQDIYNFEDMEKFLNNLTEENWFESTKKLSFQVYKYPDYYKLEMTREQFLLFEKINEKNKWTLEMKNKKFLIFSLKMSLYNKLKNTNQDLTEIRQDIKKWINDNMHE